MEQYYRLFTSYRYPGAEKDKLVTRDLSEVAENAHAIVVCHDQVGSDKDNRSISICQLGHFAI